MLVEETYVTDRGRIRRRAVAVDLGAVRARLRAAGGADRAGWEQIRAVLLDAVGESTFEIWLTPVELLAVDLDGELVVTARPPDHCRFASEAAAARIGTSPRPRPGTAASNLAADCCFDDAAPWSGACSRSGEGTYASTSRAAPAALAPAAAVAPSA